MLRPCFGDLVDVATLYFGIPPMDSYDVGVPGRRWSDPGSEAQTFGSRIYFRKPRSDVPLVLMEHEMIHVQQWDTQGRRDLGRMGQKYMRGFCDAGYSYDKYVLV